MSCLHHNQCLSSVWYNWSFPPGNKIKKSLPIICFYATNGLLFLLTSSSVALYFLSYLQMLKGQCRVSLNSSSVISFVRIVLNFFVCWLLWNLCHPNPSLEQQMSCYLTSPINIYLTFKIQNVHNGALDFTCFIPRSANAHSIYTVVQAKYLGVILDSWTHRISLPSISKKVSKLFTPLCPHSGEYMIHLLIWPFLVWE